MKKVSLNDIALKLNVSKTLVSFVLNGRGDEKGISKATQKRVQVIARELNYKPNHFARGLRLGKTHTIGLIVADISNKFLSKVKTFDPLISKSVCVRMKAHFSRIALDIVVISVWVSVCPSITQEPLD